MNLKYVKHSIGILFFFVLVSCGEEKVEKANFDDLIAPEALLIVQFNDYSKWKTNLQSQRFLSKQKSNALLEFWSVKEFESLMDLPDELMLSYNILGKNTPVQTLVFQENNKDTLKLASKQSYTYDKVKIDQLNKNNKDFYTTGIGGFRILSNSKIILENIIRNYTNAIKAPLEVQKLFNGLSSDSPSVVVNTNLFLQFSTTFFSEPFPKDFLKLSEYLGFDLKFDSQKIFLSGIVFNSKDIKTDWSDFSRVKAEESLVAEVLPHQFISAKSLIIDDYYKLYPTNLATENPIAKDSLLINIKEVTDVEFVDGYARIFLSANIDQTFERLKTISVPETKFSSSQIHKFNKSHDLNKILQPYLPEKMLKYYSIENDFIICSNTVETLENLIIQINNKNVLVKDPNYKNHMDALYGKNHMLWISNTTQQDKSLKSKYNSNYQDAFKSLDWKDNELIISQLLVEDNFAYLNILSKQTPENKNKVEVSQQIRLKHDKDLVSSPKFFKNWRTGQHDVVYQDVTNTLYLKDTKANLIWSKKLDSRIIGDISIIDIYQNGRLQMAFTTQNKVYIIDKNGNDVAPFPIESRRKITQSLSVFDYDKNGKYRFVVVMDDKVRMYDKQAKRVRGFKFRNAKAPLAFPLKHLRIGTKDYIIAQETSGKLHILNRRGKERVEVDDSFRHSEYQWYAHDNKFVSINDKGNILEIDQDGKLKTIRKEWLNPKFNAGKNYLVSMSENEFKINDKTIELPFGVYTKPIIMKKHVGIADSQAQKIYILDFDGNVLEGFPSFGKRITDYYYKAGSLYLLCQDEDKAMLVYKASFN